MRDINYHKQAHKCLQQIVGKTKGITLEKQFKQLGNTKAAKPNQCKIEKPASPIGY